MDAPVRSIRHPWDDPPAEGTVQQVAPGILWIRLPLPMALDHVNVYALEDGDGWTVVDTGLASRRGREIWQKLLDGPLRGRPVRRLVVTHHHPDHIGLAGWFQDAHGAELWTTRTAWLMARMLTLDVQERPSREALTFYRSAGMPAAIYEERANSRPFNFHDVVAPLPLGFRRIRDGDTIRIGGRSWSVWTGHGHAPEHATLWCAADKLALTGDQILPGISPNLGVYPTEPEADPVGDWLASCRRLLGVADPETLVLPGHKLPFHGADLRLDQLIENHIGALARLHDYLEVPRAAADCFPPLFKREIGAAEYGLALVETVGHLNHLLQTGRAERRRRADGAWLWHRI